jgi:hypothetical protein
MVVATDIGDGFNSSHFLYGICAKENWKIALRNIICKQSFISV